MFDLGARIRLETCTKYRLDHEVNINNKVQKFRRFVLKKFYVTVDTSESQTSF